MSTRAKVNKTKETLNYKEVKTVYSDQEANDLLARGYKFVYVGASHVDNNGFNCKTTFILAK